MQDHSMFLGLLPWRNEPTILEIVPFNWRQVLNDDADYPTAVRKETTGKVK